MSRPRRRAVLAALGAVSVGGAGVLALDAPLRSSVVSTTRRRLGGGQVEAAEWTPAPPPPSSGCFDGPEDWHRFGDLVADPGTGGVALSVSWGRDDPFREQTQRYRDACRPTPAGGIGDGAHTTGYWRSLVPDWLRLAGAVLGA